VGQKQMKGLEGAQVLCSVYIRGLVMGDSPYLVFGWLIFYLVTGTSNRNRTQEGTSSNQYYFMGTCPTVSYQFEYMGQVKGTKLWDLQRELVPGTSHTD